MVGCETVLVVDLLVGLLTVSVADVGRLGGIVYLLSAHVLKEYSNYQNSK